MNTSVITIICISSALLVIYLAFLNEESRLLKIIYKKLSKMNPKVRKKVFTSLPSKQYTVNGIISILEDVTNKKSVTGGIIKVDQSYQKMEKLTILYAKKVGVLVPSNNSSGNSKIDRLRNINRILDTVTKRIKL